MRIYISTRGDALGIARAKAAAELCEKHGHTITMRWWEQIEAKIAQGVTNDLDLTPAERVTHASNDFDGVRHADAVLYLEPHEKSEGAAWELGLAWGIRNVLGAPFVIVVGERRGFMFSELCDRRVPTVEHALDVIGIRAA